MENACDTKQIDNSLISIAEVSEKIQTSIIEILENRSSNNISKETREILIIIKFYIRNATLNKAICSRTNITHLIATLADDSTDKDISNSVLEDVNVLIALLEETRQIFPLPTQNLK